MKTAKWGFFALVLVISFVMTLTSANAAVEGKYDQAVIGFLNMTTTEVEHKMSAHLVQMGAADVVEGYAGEEQSFRFPEMLQRVEDDAFEGTAIARLVDREEMSVSATAVPISFFRLPEMLEIIGDEAFEGNIAEIIELPQGVESIGERAFAGNTSLRSIRIPPKTHSIAKNAFEGSHQVMISGVPGSYAKTWARENGIPFSPVTMICAGVQNVSGHLQLRDTDIETMEDNSGEGMETYPARRCGEIKAEFYEKQISHQVQGRSPPSCA